MIEPTDDDERTNSLGLFNTAEAYRLSAMALPDIKGGHAEKPQRFLYCHALELYLKALLRQKHSMATVRGKFGHQIKLLMREAEMLGLIVRENDRTVSSRHSGGGIAIKALTTTLAIISVCCGGTFRPCSFIRSQRS